MKKFLSSLLLISVIGCSTESNKVKTRVIFETKAEAEQAAKDLDCKGAHKMGDKWMPCKSHRSHEKHNKQLGHKHQHNH